MALVERMERLDKDQSDVHRPTRCTYSILDACDGTRVLQLDTYGTASRRNPDKVSQSLQFNRASASQLLELIHESFPDLR
jgi:hypothetical protein